MRLYLAGEPPLTEALSKVMKRRLFTYFYHGFNINNRLSKEIKLAHEYGMDLFLDSGAYSAYTQEKKIPVERYADFIQKYRGYFSEIANLDDIGDTGPKSWDNLKALESLGCKVMPVFHYHDDISYLKKMIENYPYIALGGLVGSRRRTLDDWLYLIWHKYLAKPNGIPRLNVHGFGLTDFELMFEYPWYSVDSSSWVQAGIFGACVFYDRERRKLRHVVFSEESAVEGQHYSRLAERGMTSDIDKWLLEQGVTAQQCASHYGFRHIINANTYQNLESLAAKTLLRRRARR